mgnify:CR=1 FL=1
MISSSSHRQLLGFDTRDLDHSRPFSQFRFHKRRQFGRCAGVAVQPLRVHHRFCLGLRNILAREFVVPEFLQHDATPQNLAAKMSYPEVRMDWQDPNKEYPADKIEPPLGLITPAKAVGTIYTDQGYYPVDAEGNQLKWLNRPAVLQFYKDPTVNEIRMGMPGFFDIAGKHSLLANGVFADSYIVQESWTRGHVHSGIQNRKWHRQ